MKISEKTFFKNVCKYCIDKYTISNNGPLMASLINQLCNRIDMDVPAVQGIVRLRINDNYSRSFAHCFNVYNGNIIDASIYQYALIYRSIENLFPTYVVQNTPDYIDYRIDNKMSIKHKVKFNKELLENILKNIEDKDLPEIKRFNLNEDSKKENLFYL
ncbi:hypothetical protein [Clostridium kluyveri]|uniref:Uncharacterized protein n=2 Tax=Clostridium kluyveri TaxID=1534 RepID=A5N7M1_CLOK5|nr:hypothetical protein [Clostridium kluyveri]EDK33302.1 Conserved hypothetical protein [Clostridium kluyveri DSM 555]BAH06208.1 hypothetical protein CKR_1157 [Clostridium kluyveri NBRC 12016]